MCHLSQCYLPPLPGLDRPANDNAINIVLSIVVSLLLADCNARSMAVIMLSMSDATFWLNDTSYIEFGKRLKK